MASTNTLLLLGLLSSLLLFALALLLARTEARATAIATRMTENYRRSERRFRNAMLYSPIGKALLDHEGRIVEANPALGQIVGRDPDSLVGERFAALFDAEGGRATRNSSRSPTACTAPPASCTASASCATHS